jgi:2-polyprenyl-6-methoxyphenol hydroxylase-like FAD-dependent oxidoreductase
MQGIKTLLLETEKDFDRNFRGDTVHPSTMEVLDQLDLVKGLMKFPHTKVDLFQINKQKLVNISSLKSKFNYVTLLHQKDLLKYLTDKAKKFPSFTLLMQTNAQELIKKGEKVVGVKCLQKGKWLTVKADLIIGADGRFSKMRKEGDFKSKSKSVPMDVLWFKLPKNKNDKNLSSGGKLGKGSMLVVLEREEHWQLGYIIAKGEYSELKEEGFPKFKKEFLSLAPNFKDRINLIKGWKNVSLLNVESSLVKRWYRDGLLLIGDAAHVMSPVGGVGINYAVKDAVTTANLLSKAIKNGTLTTRDLAKVQRSRKLPTQLIQHFQSFAQSKILSPTLHEKSIPLPVKILFKFPYIQNILARIIGIGFKRVLIDKSIL